MKLADVYDNVTDSNDAEKRKKAIEKARRAIALAGDDPRLMSAVKAVRELLG